ncbi:hypothetical protein GALL_251780 [mine drainage metagenome]|uniref:YCII-related domain-containing protein n=1 Tax=mine drainage metagenome TaxID=410659 RepID=A0A1J5RTT5_9ZZZZ
MTTITDDFMKQMMVTTKAYTIVILKEGPNRNSPDLNQIVWEHGRRNFSLRADGILSVVCPIRDGSNINGIGIFNADENETKKIMDDDPGVKAGIFIYEIHPTRSFPGDSLPK